jgi:hypothetical protein
MLKTSLKILGLLYRIEKRAKIGTKPPKTSWVLFEFETFVKNCQKTFYNILGLLLQNLKIDKKPPKTLLL